MCNSKENRAGETHNLLRPVNAVVADRSIPLPAPATNNCPYIVTDLYQYPSDVSDAESSFFSNTSRTPTTHLPDLTSCGLVKVDAEDVVHGLIKQQLLFCLGETARTEVEVVSIYKKNWSRSSSLTTQVKAQVYHLHHQILEKDGYGSAKFAWFSTSKERVNRIMTYGFGLAELEENDGLYGRGVYLSPGRSLLESVALEAADEDGLRHILLCRVLMGKPEVIRRGSRQSHPSSEEFTSGVDSPSSPKRYIVWSHNMNTHILPEYLVTFKAPLKTVINLNRGGAEKKKKRPSSLLLFMSLVESLVKFLPPASIDLIVKSHKDYEEGRIQRNQLMQVVRRLGADELLMSVLKSGRDKNLRVSL